MKRSRAVRIQNIKFYNFPQYEQSYDKIFEGPKSIFFLGKKKILVLERSCHNFLHTGRKVVKFYILNTYCSRSLHFCGYFTEISALSTVARGYPTHAKSENCGFWTKIRKIHRNSSKITWFYLENSIGYLFCVPRIVGKSFVYLGKVFPKWW